MPTKTFFELSSKKKERILQTAYRLFGTLPYEKVSIQAIIEGSDIPRGSFYQYFTDKEDLYLYCLLENSRKSFEIVYQENMDFIFHSILLGEGSGNFTAPWYEKALSDMNAHMTEEELYFYENRSVPPETLQCSYYSRLALLIYPLLQRHADSLKGIANEQKRDCLLFLLSQISLLIYQYEKTKGTSHEEAAAPVQSMIRMVYESFRSPDSAGALASLNRLSSLHFLSACGLDLTITFTKDVAWKCETREGQTLYEATLPENSLKGSLPVTAEDLSAGIPTCDSCVQLIVDDNRHCSFCIASAGRKYSFNDIFSAIGGSSDHNYTCVVEQGSFVL